jgi:hypothetical protein
LLGDIKTEQFNKLGVVIVQKEAKLYLLMLKKPLETVEIICNFLNLKNENWKNF